MFSSVITFSYAFSIFRKRFTQNCNADRVLFSKSDADGYWRGDVQKWFSQPTLQTFLIREGNFLKTLDETFVVKFRSSAVNVFATVILFYYIIIYNPY